LLRRQTVEDGEGGKGGSCATDSAATGDFDPFSGLCTAVVCCAQSPAMAD
jgi:hypothetical protein